MRLAALAIAIASAIPLAAQGLPVPYERLAKADQEPGNWLMYSSTYNSWRFSRLDQINTQNVKNLQVKWLFQGRHQEKFETTPLVVDGIMYLTRPENDVYALDAETGRVMWVYNHKNPERTYNCCGRVNRGLAILGNRLFMGTLDMHLIAIDAKSGRELWKTEMFDYTASGGYAATGAPLAVKDKVIIGMAGGEHSISGFLDAYDAATGKRVWRFNTIPQPGEPNFGTWDGDSWKTGGVATWNNGSYDPETNTVYLGHQQSVAGLQRRFPQGRQPVLVLGGRSRRRHRQAEMVLPAHSARHPRLGRYPDPGSVRRPLSGPRPQADGVGRSKWLLLPPGPEQRPIPSGEEFRPADMGQGLRRCRTSPGDSRERSYPGGHRHRLPRCRRRRELDVAQLQSADQASVCLRARRAARLYQEHDPPCRGGRITRRRQRRTSAAAGGRGGGGQTNGIFGAGGNLPEARGGGRGRARFLPEESWGKVVAIDPLSGEIKWEHKVISPPWGGVMSTAGNLVFGGTQEGVVFALDSRTGERLWYFAANERVYASPISYLANGKQYVSLAVGDVLVTFGF